MALTSNRLAIAQGLVSLLQGITNPNTSQPLYGAVKLGALFNPSNLSTWAEVIHMQGKGGPVGSGGPSVGWRIDEEITYLITSGVGPYETDSTASQMTMLTIQDILLPTLHQHFQLPVAGNPTIAIQSVYSVLPMQVDRSRPVKFPDGHVWLLWDVPVIVKQQYSISLVQP
jgi:hypothetical protein